MMDCATGEGMVAGSVVALVAEVVRRSAGDAAVDELLARAGHGHTAEEIADIARWSTFDEAMELFEAGAELIDEPELGFRVGEEMLRRYRGTEVHALLRSLGSPGEVISNIAQSAAKFTTAHVLRTRDLSDDGGVVTATSVVGGNHPMWCGFTRGLLSQTSSLFGMDDSEVTESTCQRRGDEQCTFVVRWNTASGPASEADRRVLHLEEQVVELTARFEALQATATALVAAEDVNEVVQEIISRAGFAVRATQYVLAVRLTPDEAPRVGHRGFDADGPGQELVMELLSSSPDDREGSRLIVDVATRRQWFGRLAALCPPGSTFLAAERRLLEAYAANAATALEAAAALDEANRRHETARALLELSTALGEVGTPEEVAQRLAESVPPVIGSEQAAVMLWNESDSTLSFAGFARDRAVIVEGLGDVVITAADTPAVALMSSQRGPLFVDRSTDDPFLVHLMDLTSIDHAVVLPIATSDRFLGVVAAALPGGRGFQDGDMVERLQGITSQGARALENARLIEEIHHQGLHDPLSGLPNRRLFGTRLNRALEQSGRTGSPPAVIFLDLDHFKALNDSCGHEAGDKVIVAVADRMRRAVRASDTVARLGGDEFAVILENLRNPEADSARIAESLLEVVRQPLVAMGRTIRVSASAGAVVAGPDDDHDSVLRRADANMYAAKSIGRDQAVVDVAEASS